MISSFFTKKTIKALAVPTILMLFGAFAAVQSAFAAVTPTLSLSSLSGGSVQVSVNGDANQSVMFYYNVASASGMQVTTLGSTNSAGYFTTTVNASSYGIISGNNVYVVVDGAQSVMQPWPTPSGTPTLSQTSVTVGLGQQATLYETNGSAPLYMASNANPSIATVSVSGTQITVTGSQTGGTVANICYTGTASNCIGLAVTVQSGSVLSFSQNNITIAQGQNTTVTVSGGSGSYSVTNNSNPSDVSAVLSGSTITLYGSALGSANITVCDSNGRCGTLYVTTGTTSSSGSLYFSNTNPTLTVGQATTLTVSGGSGYYVTGNTNPSAVSQSVSGNTITLTGQASGSATITVCSASNGCGTFTVTVNGSSSGGYVTFGVTNPTVVAGQTYSVSLSGASSYYVSATANANILQGSVNGSTLTLTGESAGSASITVCASGGNCSTIYATVTAANSGTASSGGSASNATLLAAIQSVQSQLAQMVTQLQSMATTLTQAANALTASSGTASNTGSTSASSRSSSYDFTEFLDVGSTGTQVEDLQNYLAAKGFFTGTATGYFGTATEQAVKAYQAAHGIKAAGYVGPGTRAAMNAGE